MARPTNSKPNEAEVKAEQETATKTAKAAEAEKAAVKLPTETVIYLGPNHPTGGLHTGQVFKAPMHGFAKEVYESAPAIMRPLFASVSGLSKAKQALSDPDSDHARAYREAAQHFRGGKQQ